MTVFTQYIRSPFVTLLVTVWYSLVISMPVYADAQSIIGAYIGYSAAVPPISSLSTTSGRFIQRAILGFARDPNCLWNNCPAGPGDGHMIAQWDTNMYSSSAIGTDKQANPNRKWMVSLFGDKPNWADPADPTAWVNNAKSSITSLISTYHLDGIDINLENGCTNGWVDIMKSLITQLKAVNPNLIITLGPFSATWQYYVRLYKMIPTLIDGINYQYYADGDTNIQSNVDHFTALARDSSIPLSAFFYMLNTNERGIQAPDSFTVVAMLRQQNPPIRGVTVWGADDDWQRAGNYLTEQQLTQCGWNSCQSNTHQQCINPFSSACTDKQAGACPAGSSSCDNFVCPYTEGQVLHCPTDGGIYKFTGGQLRHFSPSGYASSGYPAFTDASCEVISLCPRGPDINCLFADGSVVRCPSSGAIYRISTGGVARWYTYPGWVSDGQPGFTDVDCNAIAACPQGDKIIAAANVPANAFNYPDILPHSYRIVPINADCNSWKWNVAGDSYSNGAAILLYWDGILRNINTNMVLKNGDNSIRTRTWTNYNCLDVPNNNGADGQVIQQYVCNGTPAQQFQVSCDNLDRNPQPNYYADYCMVRHIDSGLCIAPDNWPGQIKLTYCNPAWNGGKMWRFCLA